MGITFCSSVLYLMSGDYPLSLDLTYFSFFPSCQLGGIPIISKSCRNVEWGSNILALVEKIVCMDGFR